MSVYDKSFLQFEPRFSRMSEKRAEAIRKAIIQKNRFQQSGDFKRYWGFEVSDKDFAIYMSILGLGVGAGTFILGVYLGNKFGFANIGLKSGQGILERLFPKKVKQD